MEGKTMSCFFILLLLLGNYTQADSYRLLENCQSHLIGDFTCSKWTCWEQCVNSYFDKKIKEYYCIRKSIKRYCVCVIVTRNTIWLLMHIASSVWNKIYIS
uniref:Uncharacterized protein n=1 Tax=Triticum urartu TaxID=4572 RepID=A0A8R7U3J7_TRIUA